MFKLTIVVTLKLFLIYMFGAIGSALVYFLATGESWTDIGAITMGLVLIVLYGVVVALWHSAHSFKK